MRYVLSAALAGLTLAAAAHPASAVIKVDVDNYESFSPVGGSGAVSYLTGSPSGLAPVNITEYQTWTAGLSGRLVAIQLFGFVIGLNGNYYLDVFKGADPFAVGAFSDNKIIGQVAMPFAASRPSDPAYPMIFSLSRFNILAEAGDRFTFRLRVDGCATATCGRQFITAYDGSGGRTTRGYSGGALYRSVNRATLVELPADANFRTYVDAVPEPAPVPEPATWAMLVLGFFAGGAFLRRRQRALPSA